MSLSYKKISFRVILIAILFISATFLMAEDGVNLDKKINLNAVDASIPQVISTLAKLGNCNIVLSMDVEADDEDKKEEKKVTIQLNEVALEQAVNLVVKAVGLSYRIVGDNTFLVGPKERINQEMGQRSYVVNLNYVEAEKLVKALENMPGSVVEIEGQNALLVSANPETFASISARIQEIDVPRKQIEIRARLIEINISESERYGIDWSRLDHLTTILAEDPVNAQGVGLPYSYNDETGALPFGSLEDFETLPEQQYFQKMDDWSDVGHFSRQLTAFDITLDWLLENNAAQMLTDTRLTALNGELAEIHIGEVVPFVVKDGDNEIQVEREEVGIKLTVQPNVNKDGKITTHIQPEVSSVTELVGGYVPRTKVRKINSTVTVPDGSKILVGGLLSSSTTTKTNKIPFLSDIPYIGKIFTHKEEVVNNTDLVIELTPRIVNIEDISFDFDVDERLERKLIKEK